jgi:pimeloyl-ACP methyl ester carboxylesterase
MDDPCFIAANGRLLATQVRPGTGATTLMFLPGYASDMGGTKALALDALAERRGLALVRFDYSGCGQSAGEFADGTLERWVEDAVAVLDAGSQGPMILCGSSMGGWAALHVALRRPERVAALIGIAAAPDFTEWGYSRAEKATIEQVGVLERANAYAPEPMRTFAPFWRSGQAMRLLDGPIEFDGRVRLIHGEADPDVPLHVASRLMAALRSDDVQLTVIKNGGHRLSAPHELRAIEEAVERLLEA